MELDFLYKVVNTKTWIEKDIMEALVIYGLYIHSFQITVDITCRFTEFENHKKVSFYIASEVDKNSLKMVMASFWKSDACSQTVLTDTQF